MNSSLTRGLYSDVLDFAHTTPSWFQFLAEIWTEAGLLLFGVLFLVVWWQARPGGSRAVAVAVLAPVGTAVAYVCSEAAKSVIQENRPCRTVTDAVSLVPCPPVGDWSFPSNHSTIAAAAAVTLVLARRGLAWLTVPMALLMGFSRVFVGVHYPHDVAVGLVLGTVAATLFVLVATRPVQRLVESMRGSGSGAARWLAGPGDGAGDPAGDGAGAGAGAGTGRGRPAGSRGRHSAGRS
ncbi:phosphatase PAP2 family protein [Streptomyces sp. NPDC093085]|uniref:phosphatase PAP2 family protein n=1 Tax=Streptomyces sp. NPDC093085 TaxID=3155068 RepID=UPI003438DA11